MLFECITVIEAQILNAGNAFYRVLQLFILLFICTFEFLETIQ